MLPSERREHILHILKDGKSKSVAFLAKHFDVSQITIRKDLAWLESKGLIYREHGGAFIKDKFTFVSDYNNHDARLQQNVQQKKAMALEVIKLIQEGDSIAIGGGTTTKFIVKELIDKLSNSTIISNSLEINNLLIHSDNIKLIQIGGEFLREERLFVGPLARMSLSKLNSNKSILTGLGFTLQHGLTDSNLYIAEIKHMMCEMSDTVIVAVDSSKIGQFSHAPVVPTHRIDILVTDSGIKPDIKNKLEKNGIKVIIATLDSDESTGS